MKKETQHMAMPLACGVLLNFYSRLRVGPKTSKKSINGALGSAELELVRY